MCAAPSNGRAAPGGWRRRLSRLVRGALARGVPDWPLGPARRQVRAVIFKVDRIGDLVLALGAIRLVLREWGEENCLLVVSAFAEELVAREFPRTPRLILPASVGHRRLWSEAWKARRALRGISCDVALSLRHQRWDFDELSLSWVRAKAVHVLEDVAGRGMVAEWRTYSLARATRTIFQEEPPVAEPRPCRELRMHRQLLAVVLGRAVGQDEVLPVMGPEGPAATGAVILSPLGSNPLRDLPLDYLAAVLAVLRDAGRPALLAGSASQSPRLADLVASLRARGFDQVRQCSDLALADFIRALAAAPLVVTTESAAAHLATALDRPTVVILGGGHYGQFGPWWRSDRQIWLTKKMDCFGCNWRCIYPEPYCVTGLPLESLTEAVRRRLPERGAAGGLP